MRFGRRSFQVALGLDSRIFSRKSASKDDDSCGRDSVTGEFTLIAEVLRESVVFFRILVVHVHKLARCECRPTQPVQCDT